VHALRLTSSFTYSKRATQETSPQFIYVRLIQQYILTLFPETYHLPALWRTKKTHWLDIECVQQWIETTIYE